MRRARGERGQILAVVVLALVCLLGIAAFAIDVGYAYYAKRQLQSATDAAALAGAQDLPVAATAINTATDYAAANKPDNLSSMQFTYQTKCTATSVIATGCNPSVNPNALVVSGTAQTDTWFAKVFGIDHFDVSAHANACSPCSASPVDILVAIDRTGSMCRPSGARRRAPISTMRRTASARMLEMFNPPSAQIGMVAFPPLSRPHRPLRAAFNSGGSATPATTAANRGYVTDIVNGGYRDAAADGLNHASGLYLHTAPAPAASCIQAAGNTSYSEALRQAQAEVRRERPPGRTRLHRLPDRRRGQHRQRLRGGRSPLPAGQR